MLLVLSIFERKREILPRLTKFNRLLAVKAVDILLLLHQYNGIKLEY